MDNWNYDKAVTFVNGIEDPVSRGLTRLFLDRLVFFVSRKTAYPQSDFDLQFFTQAVFEVTRNVPLLQAAINGNNAEPASSPTNAVS